VSIHACSDLQPLRRLRHIEFSRGTVEDALFKALVVPSLSVGGTATEWSLPKLERISFDQIKFTPEPNSVAAFLRARNNASLAVIDGVHSPSKISSVTFIGELCDWLVAEVGLLLGHELDFDQEVASTIDGDPTRNVPVPSSRMEQRKQARRG